MKSSAVANAPALELGLTQVRDGIRTKLNTGGMARGEALKKER